MSNTGSESHGLAVEVHDLKKSYGDLAAVSNVSFDIARGEVFCLLGPTAPARRRRSRSWRASATATEATYGSSVSIPPAAPASAAITLAAMLALPPS
jgi:hypothetical protein